MKKRFLSLLLCICLLVSTAVLFSSCGKKTVDFANGYTVVYANDVSVTTLAEINTFVSTLKNKADSEISLKKVKHGSDLENEADFEILVGNTNRPETAKVLKKIKGDGYAIAVSGNKLVIVGTTNFLTSLAIEKFAENYLNENVSVLEIKNEINSNMEMLEINEKWAFIYSSYLDGSRDYVNGCIQDAKSQIGSFSSVRGTAMPTMNDGESAGNEILVGIVDRAESKAMTSSMTPVHYGIGALDGKLTVSGLNDAMVDKAFTLFKDMLRDSVREVEGKQKLFVPAEFVRIYTDTASTVVTDFPRPEGLTISGSIDVHDGMEYYYSGDGVTADAYQKYCADLVAAGYTLHTDNTAETSVFRTYVNQAANITLYVAYNAFKHAEEQNTNHQKAIRVVASRLDAVNLLEEDLLTKDLSYQKLQNSSITAVKLNYPASTSENPIYGNIYVVTLEDGSFIVLDGGMDYTADRDRIYNVLLDLYKRGHNDQEPTTEDPIRVAAWYLSHGHGDHYNAMKRFIEFYCAKYTTYCVTVDRLIANFASNEEHYNSESSRAVGGFNSTVRDNYAKYSALVKDAPGEEPGFKYIKVHTGQKFWLANVELEVLHTHEDQYPKRIHVYNNTTTIIRMNMHHTEGGEISEGSKTSMLWLGDAQQSASACVRAAFGSYVQSDMVQVAHHGGYGCEWSLYKLVKPKCAFFPVSQTAYKGTKFHNNTGAETGYGCSYNINYKLSSLQYVILSDYCNYTLTITATGPDFRTESQSPTGVFSAGESVAITLGTVSATTATGFMRSKYNNG